MYHKLSEVLFFSLQGIVNKHCTFSFSYSQVHYDLDGERRKINAYDIAICRVEQLCPFPYDLVQQELKRYPSKHTCERYSKHLLKSYFHKCFNLF